MQKLLLAALFSLFALIGVGQIGHIAYATDHGSWNPDSLGNHRIVVKVSSAGTFSRVNIPWRRRDSHPEEKGIIVVDARTNKQIVNFKIENITRESGTIYFEPSSGPGTYYIYYMPYHLKGTYYPSTHYFSVVNSASQKWLSQITSLKSGANAKVIGLESIDDFNRFDPMEVIATQAETKALQLKNKESDFVVFPEDRMHPIRMTADLPLRWIKKGATTIFKDSAKRGENFAYQLGVYPLTKDLKDVKVSFSDLTAAGGKQIDRSVMECINNQGVNWIGIPETFVVNIAKQKVQALWCTVNIPNETKPGVYKGTAVVSAANAPAVTVQIIINVGNTVAKNHGVDQPWKQTRLTWLNSTLAEENTVMAPYIPLHLENNEINLLGRQLVVAPTGFPAQMKSFFSPRMTSIVDSARNLLTEPVHFHFNKENGKEVKFTASPLKYTEKSAGTIKWEVDNKAPELDMEVKGALEFDGFVNYEVRVIALEDIALKNISLHLPMVPAATKYIMGLGYEGQQTPDTINWKWQVATKNQDGAWLGDVNAGLQYSLRDQHYERPLNTNFYLQKPLVLPDSWGNGEKGGIHMFQKGAAFLVDNYTGARNLKKGDTLYFDFRLLMTPFHTLDTKTHFANRYLHKYINPDTAKALGATVINIHQGTPINAYINYPFIQTKEMKAYIDSAHRDGLKVKIYNTVRELSNRAYELPALFSLGHEIYSAGKGGGYSWLMEHLDPDYIAAWYTPEVKDAAIVNSGMSRWHNYYVEGMNWLTKNIGIDGVYLDDVAFDRDIMKRIKRVLTADQHPGLIDLHSASQYDKADGYINSAMLYMELFPYLNRLWFGEKFDYEKSSKDYYLTEMSGIPFGLMGEMLENDGNPWRGMVYGMTNRLMWSATADPRPLWKEWDRFGITDAEMIGYWATDNPIKTNRAEVPATIYKKGHSVLISVASWATTPVDIHLAIDWKALGMDPAKVTLKAPSIDKFQQRATFEIGSAITIEPGKGLLLELNER
ncbi:MAG TPA: glycoside hydrolase domain-containing protein [Arachidicoccus sp.]|nr:glycoside hydrolase domain-containing protein [Arachidicoccus sp.]